MRTDPVERHLPVQRTARYYLLGDVRVAGERWFVLHGYGQLAGSFIRSFAALAGPERAVVAPEALSRFYLDAMHEHEQVGASWMTKADRLREIDDYLAYLDALAAHLDAASGEPVETCVLGFSQGTATACRWVARGEAPADRLILWAGGIPPDLDLERHRALLQQLDLTLVVGMEDTYIPEERVTEETTRLDDHGIPYRTIRFDGGHRLDPDVLRRIA